MTVNCTVKQTYLDNDVASQLVETNIRIGLVSINNTQGRSQVVTERD